MTTCPTCGIKFTPTPRNPVYCTPACQPEVVAERAAAAAAVRPAPTATKPKRRTRSERFAVLNAFTDFSLAGLTGAETKVWLILFRDAKSTTGTAQTGQTDIARRAGLTTRAVKLALRSLTTKGLVRVVRRGRLNAGPSVYATFGTRCE
jgi:hypothetical protein